MSERPTNCKIVILQRFSCQSESPKPHLGLLRLRVWHQEVEPPRALGFEEQRAWVQQLRRTG